MQGFRGGIHELVRQTQRLQRKVDEAKAAIKDEEVTAQAASGKATCVVTCEGRVKSLSVEPDLLAESRELAMDALVAAVNAALDAADKRVEEAIGKATGGLKLPGM